MEKWYAAYDKVTKELYSTGTVVDYNAIPEYLEIVELAEKPDFVAKEWNKNTLTMVEKLTEEKSSDMMSVILQEISEIKILINTLKDSLRSKQE